jgi:transposase
MLPDEIQKGIEQLPEDIQILFQAAISFYEQKVVKLEARIKELEDQISKNSNKPPSSDGSKRPSPKSLREKPGRMPGGQKGHKGGTLKMAEHPDLIEVHKVGRCECCKKSLLHQKPEDVLCRQVYDIPPLKIAVTEHRAEIKTCRCGHPNIAAFPTGVDRYVQYGPNIKGLIVYLQDYQLLPCERTTELISDLFGHGLSKGTLQNTRDTAFERLGPFDADLKELLPHSPLAGFDETGFRIAAKRFWLHSCSTGQHAYYAVHEKRGAQAMGAIGVLPNFRGVGVHDFWKSYFTYDMVHSLCNAHSLRDLIFIKERFSQAWPEDMTKLLIKMKEAKEKAVSRGKTAFSKTTLSNYRKRYGAIVKKGLQLNPHGPPAEKKRGKAAKSPPLNLLERLRDHAEGYLRFLHDFKVPFDNNFSERDIRMMKVKQKISGCFRSMNGAEIFARIRSYIVTARKQCVNVFDALTNLFMGNSIAFNLTSSQPC